MFNKKGFASLGVILLIIGGIVLIGGGVLAGYWFARQTSLANIVPVTDNNIPTDTTTLPINVPQEPTVEFAKDFDFAKYVLSTSTEVASSSAYINYSLPKDFYKNITWKGYRTLMPSLNLIKAEVDNLKMGKIVEGGNVVVYYDMGGRFIYQDKLGAIIVAGLSCDSMGCGMQDREDIFVLYDEKVVLLKTYTNKELENLKDFFRSGIRVDETASLNIVEFPKYIYGSDPRQKLSFSVSSYLIRELNKRDYGSVVFQDKILGDVYIGSGNTANDYKVITIDGRVGYYKYYPDFVGKNIVLTNGKNLNDYELTHSGCGGSGVNRIDYKPADIEKELVVVGKNQFGDKIYELADKDSSIYHEFYDSTYYPSSDGKVPYEKFVADKPLYLWQDPFGYWVAIKAIKYQPMAECGKPVIYLYPEKTTKVKVQVELNKWSVSEPEYNNGWEVVAEPNGRLTETKSNTVYPYLFWEGQGVGSVPDNHDGFVIKREEVSKFLREKLLVLGLNEKESADFREFWEPRMTKAPYYFVTFYGTNAMNTIAPLKIDPKPDTVIRILMDYKPLLKPVTVKEQNLRAITRTGFTVIEWGGVLGRE